MQDYSLEAIIDAVTVQGQEDQEDIQSIMTVTKLYFVLGIVLLIVVCCGTRAQAASQYANVSHLQCNQADKTMCKQIIDVFETALIADDTNIFTLRNVFFPAVSIH